MDALWWHHFCRLIKRPAQFEPEVLLEARNMALEYRRPEPPPPFLERTDEKRAWNNREFYR
jgi:hypothetical protein